MSQKKIKKGIHILIVFMIFMLIGNVMYGMAKEGAAADGIRDAYIDMQMDRENT